MMRRIGIFYHPLKDTACSLAKEITEFLRERRVAVWLASAFDWDKVGPQLDHTDMVITAGGDGTILRAAQAVAPRSIPIVGVNMGRLGFMTELSVAETMETLPRLLEGEGHIDERSLLDADLETASGMAIRHFHALNDVVVARGGTARLVNIEAIIDSQVLTTYRADGVVVATATGSTGYALAAGGPVLHPQSADSVLVPILPHLSFGYPMVLTPSNVCRLSLGMPTPGMLSIDGLINIELACGDKVTVRHSRDTIRFLRVHEPSFYSSLERRLKGLTR
jgi:NAD+ kinase